MNYFKISLQAVDKPPPLPLSNALGQNPAASKTVQSDKNLSNSPPAGPERLYFSDFQRTEMKPRFTHSFC